MAGSPAPLTWLQAAEYVLREEGPEMHIKDLTSRILELGIVKSNCATSLETLLYRQTSGGPQGKGNSNSRGMSGPSKFIRVLGKHGWFGLKPSVLMEESDLNVSLESIDDSLIDDKNSSEREVEVENKPLVSSQQLRRKNSVHSSDEENTFFVMSSETEESSDNFEDSVEESSEDDSVGDESMYLRKYSFLKKLAKSIIFENAALADQLTKIEDRISRARVERDFLFGKLVQFEQGGIHKRSVMGILPYSGFTLQKQTHSVPRQADNARSIPRPQTEQHSTTRIPPGTDDFNNRKTARHTVQQISPLKRLKVVHSDPKKTSSSFLFKNSSSNLLMSESSGDGSGEWSESEGDLTIDSIVASHSRKDAGCKKKAKKTVVVPKKSLDDERGGDGEDEELELAMRSGKVRRLHPIPLNEDGSPVFPIVVGGLHVLNLGKIVFDRVAYHSERYLLPIGFESRRTYPSMIDPSRKCSYTCRILDGGDTPQFEMVADDNPEHPVRASSSTACQTIVLKNINRARDKQATNSGSGPEFFGYSNPTILNLIQKLPDAKKCSKYKFVRFAEPSRRGGQKGLNVGGGGARKPNVKSKTTSKINKSSKKIVAVKQKSDPKSYSKGLVTSKQALQGDSSPAIAPVLGTRLEMPLSDSSSGELSSATDNELVIDS